MTHDTTDKEGRRERFERKRSKAHNNSNDSFPRRKTPYKREHVTYEDDWEDEWDEDEWNN